MNRNGAGSCLAADDKPASGAEIDVIGAAAGAAILAGRNDGTVWPGDLEHRPAGPAPRLIRIHGHYRFIPLVIGGVRGTSHPIPMQAGMIVGGIAGFSFGGLWGWWS